MLRGCSLGINTGISLSFFSLSSAYHLLILVCRAGFRNNRSQISRSHPVAGSSRSLAGTGSPLYDDSIITQFLVNTHYLASAEKWLLQSHHIAVHQVNSDLAIFMKNVCYFVDRLSILCTQLILSSSFLSVRKPLLENHYCAVRKQFDALFPCKMRLV